MPMEAPLMASSSHQMQWVHGKANEGATWWIAGGRKNVHLGICITRMYI
jgi:hypothetical protein